MNRKVASVTILYATLMASVTPGARAAGLLFETAIGTYGNAGVALSDQNWLMHRFEVRYATELAAVGASFQNFNASTATLFGAVVRLTDLEDYPNSNALTTSDVLGTTLVDVAPTGIGAADFSGALTLSLEPGWYGLVFGTDGFGAPPKPPGTIVIPEYSVDRLPSQNPVSLLQADHPTFPNGLVTQLFDPRFFATAAPPGQQLITLAPTIDAEAVLSNEGIEINETGSTIVTRISQLSGNDHRGILEFDLSDVPRGSTIDSASLQLQVVGIDYSGDDFPQRLIYGYPGDGIITPADATEATTLVHGTGPITSTGIKTFDIDPEFFESIAGTVDYAGLLIKSGANGRLVQFAANETLGFTPPSLTISYTPPPEPLPTWGDYNLNGFPDAADYTVWRNTLHSATDRRADGNLDDVIDREDFDAWKQAYGNRPPIGLQNGDFETGDLTSWSKVVTPNGNVSSGFPRVEMFDVDGDGNDDYAMRIRAGIETSLPGALAGGGIEQEFLLTYDGVYEDYVLSADIASTNSDISGNTAPGRYELYFDGLLVDVANLNGTTIQPGQVIRGSLSGTVYNIGPGIHTVQVLFRRPAFNSREIYGYVDNVALALIDYGAPSQAVPEPATGILAAIAVSNIFPVGSRRAHRKRRPQLAKPHANSTGEQKTSPKAPPWETS
jgi:hypothetical protein